MAGQPTCVVQVILIPILVPVLIAHILAPIAVPIPVRAIAVAIAATIEVPGVILPCMKAHCSLRAQIGPRWQLQ